MPRNNKVIYSALAADLLTAAIKFIAGYFSRSSGMLAEGIHSLIDSVNEILLLYGLKESRRPPDDEKPFGYGRELYFWSFVVSMLIFGMGGGVSICEGVWYLLHPKKLGNLTWNYVVLTGALIFEGSSLMIALKDFNNDRKDNSWWKSFIKSKDPSNFMVLFEDIAAVLGIIIVLVALTINYVYKIVMADAIASILVGMLLIFVSVVLARESRSLLMGEGVSTNTRLKIKKLVEASDGVEKLNKFFSSYQSPEEILIILVVAFKMDLDTHGINTAIEHIRNTIRTDFPLIRYVIVQPHEQE